MQVKLQADGVTARLADFIAGLTYEQLDADARRAVRRHFLDTFGAALAGTQGQPTRIAAKTLAALESGGSIPLPGIAGTWQRPSGAYLLGASAHGLELDDGYRAGSVHPGAPVIPAVLAAAWGGKVDGRRVATAIAVGYEIVTRLAETVHPASRKRGFHNTSITGVLGAAAACSNLLRLDAGRTAHALGIAASSSAGIFAFLHGGGEIKRLHPGFAAREGLFAALLAQNGMTGPAGVLESEDGYLQAFSGIADANKLLAGLGQGFNVARCYIKPYSCCRHIHPGIDGVLAIKSGERIDIRDIEAIDIGTYAIAAGHAQGGWDDMASAQMNYRYCVALAALRGHVDIPDFDEASISASDIAGVAGRIAVDVDAQCDAEYPRLRSAKVKIRTKSGAALDRYVDEPLGSARYPLSDEALVQKFDGLAAPVIGQARAERIKALILDLESASDIDVLLKQPS